MNIKIVVKGKIILMLVSEKIIKNNEYILWLKNDKIYFKFKIDTKIRISKINIDAMGRIFKTKNWLGEMANNIDKCFLIMIKNKTLGAS